MGLSNGFAPAGAGGGPPASHGTTHQPGSTDPLGPLAGQTFYSQLPPSPVVDGSVWVPSGLADALRGEFLVWHSWRNSGSGRWVGPKTEMVFGSNAADGSYLELAGTDPSSDIGFLCRKDMLIVGINAARALGGPLTKLIKVVADNNISFPIYSFSVSAGTTYQSAELDLPLSASQLLGVFADSGGDPCRISVQLLLCLRRG